MSAAASILFAAGVMALTAARLHLMLHLLQLEHYESARLRLWVARRGERLPVPELALIAAAGAALTAAEAAGSGAVMLALAVPFAVVAVARALRVFRRRQAKPLVFTRRAKRLFGVALALPVAVGAALAAAALAGLPLWAALLAGTLLGLAAQVAAPELLALADRLLRPVQAADNARFVRRAKARLGEVSPVVIGITGSYGKTTTKVCVAAVAEREGPAYPTPASFNSYLGVVRAINEGLEDHHRFFVVEMGAYRHGDIAELCDLTQPRIGVLTSIGAAHLERFGTVEEIERAKRELPESLPADGALITRADSEACRRAARAAACPVRLFSPDPHPDAEVYARDARLRQGKTEFTLCVRDGAGEVGEAPVGAHLLGRHNVANLLAAAAVGVELGLPLETIAGALHEVRPPAHRLAPIVNRGAGVVVIDDAYNSNPEGARAALEVLASHDGARRILVTPGMVELGSLEESENHRLGVQAAEACDVVVLVGAEQTAPVRAGLEEAGFPESGLHVVPDSAAAQALLAEIVRRGDVVLFENDLPDLYQPA